MKKVLTIASFVACAYGATVSYVSANSIAGSLDIKYVNEYDLVWWDDGSGGDHDGSYYRPKTPAGYYRLGHYGKGGYGAPTEASIVVKELKPGMLVRPVGYTKIWDDSGSGADWDGSFWQPNPPQGYKCLGTVATRNHHQPSIDEVRCVKNELVVPGKLGGFIWNDDDTGADDDFGSWKIVSNHADGINLNMFVGNRSHHAPSSSPLFYVLNKHASGNSKLTKAEVLALIKNHGPILYLHPSENYKLDSPFNYLNNAYLVSSKGNKVKTSLATFKNDYNHIKSVGNINGNVVDNIWLEPVNGSASRPGNVAAAKTIVHVKDTVPGYTDIQYWFFYAYNGPGTAKVRFGEIYNNTGELKPFGEHTGDWEHVTFRFENSSKKLISAYFSQHNYGEKRNANQLEWDGSHVVIYSSKNGHASYANQSDNSHRVLHKCIQEIFGQCIGHLDVDLKNYTAKGTRFNTYEEGKYHVVNYQSTDWAELAFRWGPTKDVRMTKEQAQKVARDFFGSFIGNSPAGEIGAVLFSKFYTESQGGPTNIGTKGDWNNNEF
ncbi:Vps62-related protein [Spartinivicinus poritis]|uniref:Vps62-related protein n=1 Tax=Spartinivicinus poritis TaxID=2994640 RepID=A0ABT5U8V7_9GAMM|nr:Vps62-related protein [Spartinivicinus sp. A2-2]MDE1461878.1 Vps62-related protein [Spartinivicinus sp. A2-2]